MLYYSRAALRYAVDRCLEIPCYKVLISTIHIKEAYDYIGNHIYSLDVAGEPPFKAYCSPDVSSTYDFFNLSRIIIALPSTSSKGKRCHLLIADRDLGKDFINGVLRPMELLEMIN